MLNNAQKKIILEVLQPLNPRFIGIFGSYARGEENTDSDLDILVEFKDDVNLLDIIGAEMKISEKLGIKVDLITKKAVSERILPYIYSDMETLYDEE